MATVVCELDLPIDIVWGALVRPETYPHWLVGAREIRSVDEAWPDPGSRFHHRIGLAGPLEVADSTEVVAIDAPLLLGLEVRARPLGRGRATFRLHGAPGDHRTVVELDEAPIGALAILGPLLDPLTAHRNRRSLHQLEDFLVHGRSHRLPG